MDRNRSVLEKGNLFELLVKLSLPAVVVIIIMIVYNIADTYFIGQTGDPNKIAAISLSMPMFTILSGLGTLFGNGGTTALSIAFGAKDESKAKSISSFCFYGGVFVGTLYFILLFFFTEPIALLLGADADTLDLTITYLKVFSFGSPFVMFSQGFGSLLRADGDATSAMMASIIGTVSNIVLDALFILVFHWDIMGAALATVLGNIIASVLLVGIIFKRKPLLVPRIKYFTLKKEIALSVITLGLPMACSTLLSSISGAIQNRLVISYGSIALAAQGVSGKVGMVVTMLIMGVCMGIQPAISYNYGAKNYKRMYKVVFETGIFTLVLGSALAVIVFFVKDQVVAAFIDNAEVISYGRVFVLAAVVIAPFYAVYQMGQTFMQSTGKASYAIFASLLDKGLIFIPVMLVMDYLFGIYGIAFAHAVTMVFSLIVTLILTRKWSLTLGEETNTFSDTEEIEEAC
ncbi:MAG: MATE family efflux transporter [Lachnospiraceae bacterium]|nr:MATE family efflux transporter [Lachnospiraceae bacterium]